MNEEENELILAQDKAQDEIVNEKISNMNEEEKKITGEIDISKTIESNIDYWRNKCFEQQKEIEELKHDNSILCEIAYTGKRIQPPYTMVYTGTDNFISKDKIKEKIELLKDIKKANCYKQLTEDYIKGSIEQLEELLGE